MGSRDSSDQLAIGCRSCVYREPSPGGLAKWEGRGLQNRYERVRFSHPPLFKLGDYQIRGDPGLSAVVGRVIPCAPMFWISNGGQGTARRAN